MEVAHADIQKRLTEPYALLLRKVKQDMTTEVAVFSDVLRDRQKAHIIGMIDYGRRSSGLLEIKKFWFVKYNKPIYYQPKEARDILRGARSIIIPRGHEPSFLSDLKDLLERAKAPKPNIVSTCNHCLSEHRLTVLTRRNAVKVAETQISCLTCARRDLRSDMKSLNLNLSKAMLSQLDRHLSRVKSVPRILEMLSPDFDPTKQADLTLIDKIPKAFPKHAKRIADLGLTEQFCDLLLKEGFDNLLPIQEMVVDAGLFEGKDILIVSSTSSGKTLISEFAGVPKALKGRKMVYMAPLVALTNEKYEQFRRRYRSLGLRTGIKVGMSRLDVGKEGKPIVDTDITKADIVCATYEALDLIFRSGEAKQLGNVGTVIIDEIQNLGDPERGPELDGIISRIRFHAPEAQILALSATVGSPEKLANELKLKLVNHVGRPVPLERHMVFARGDQNKRIMIRKLVQAEFRNISSSGNKGQSIVFTFSRRRAHAISDWLKENGVSSVVYHGGLTYYKRRRVEKSYNKQRYACVVTTAALGAGVDLPASQVIFESLAMGADWLSTAEFEQMLGRAGRLGKHDRGKVYLIVEPERKYHGGQDRSEDEIAAELLGGLVEDVEPFADTETSAEQILATVCSTGLVDLMAVARAYNKLLSVSVPASDALKHLVKRHMIRVKEGGVYPTELGRATSLSFLKPSEGFEVLKLTSKMDVLGIAIKLEPFENVYLSAKLQSEVNSAFRTFMPTRLFSGIFLDMTDVRKPRSGAARLPHWVFQLLGEWASTFFNCGCKEYPECEHGKIALGRWIVEKRKGGLNPSGIAKRLHDRFDLWAYPGDLYSWLDTLIHNLKAVQRVAAVAGKTDLSVEIDDQIAKIERPLENEKSRN